MKTLVIRLGAIGDLVFITPVLKALKQKGDFVGLVCKGHGRAIFYRSGLIDRLHLWRPEDERVARAAGGPAATPAAAWARARNVWGGEYDRVIVLDDVIENHYLWSTKRLEVIARGNGGAWVRTVEDHSPWDKGERPFRYDNYYEVTLRAAGLAGTVPPHPVWRVLPAERRWVSKFRRKHEIGDGSLVVIQLSGSGLNKAWPYWPELCRSLLGACPGIRIVTLGVFADQMLEMDWADQDRRIIPLASRQTITHDGYHLAWDRLRREVALIESADLFVGPDTSVLHCAGRFQTPKIALMSIIHSRNVLTHYLNCQGIQSEAPCSPCGKLTVDCYRGPQTGGILCMEMIPPRKVFALALAALERGKHAACSK